MKKLVIGILAHVDAGKTTLSESMLYLSGAIRKLGRVDSRDAYLDTYELERARGITIFSKQAMFEIEDTQIILLDTPGHVDFSAEMERTLQVLDYAVLVISGADGVQGHTKTLWHLLSMYHIPTCIFVNKMDQNGTDQEHLLTEIKKQLNDGCIEFLKTETDDFYDQLAMCDETLLYEYLETDGIRQTEIIKAIRERKVFPCYFGSALKLEGVEELMHGIVKYADNPVYADEFGAKVFKIARDDQGNRLTYLKVTNGTLKIKDILTNQSTEGQKKKNTDSNECCQEDIWEEKVNQIRLYSGEKYVTVNEIEAGYVCAVTGLTKTRPGEGLGMESASALPMLEPVLSYQVVLPDGCDNRSFLPKLRQMEEEIPEMHIIWNENLQEIQAQIMGEVQIEILQNLIFNRFGVMVEFMSGNIVYKETIKNTVEGVGHFEPLRHYAEVHLLLEPLKPGSGLIFSSECSEDELDRNWQRLIISHLKEKNHKGVLTGAFLSDIKITLVAGRAHKKHTEGGDFREATYRAVRHGLKMAESVLLEPYYDFQLELPEKMIGRAMTDIEKMHGICELSVTNGGIAVLTGSAPVVTMRNYSMEVIAYTKGEGRLFCSFKGYEVCHNTEEVIEAAGYDSERDTENPTGSVFCAHGAGFLVRWDQVKDYMHIESYLQKGEENKSIDPVSDYPFVSDDITIDAEEIDRIIAKTFYANQGDRDSFRKTKSMKKSYSESVAGSGKKQETKEEYLLVDGYNIIFAWPELKELAEVTMDGARGKLMDLLCNYQGIKQCNLIVVFDAYRIVGHLCEQSDYHNIHVVFTKEAETADCYIEKFVHDLGRKFNVTVATSDGLEQIIIRGQGCALLSAGDLKEEMERSIDTAMTLFEEKKSKQRNYLLDNLSRETEQQLEEIYLEEGSKKKEER